MKKHDNSSTRMREEKNVYFMGVFDVTGEKKNIPTISNFCKEFEVTSIKHIQDL